MKCASPSDEYRRGRGGGIYWGLLLTPAVGAVLMSASTVIVAFNAKLLGRDGMPAAGHAERAS